MNMRTFVWKILVVGATALAFDFNLPRAHAHEGDVLEVQDTELASSTLPAGVTPTEFWSAVDDPAGIFESFHPTSQGIPYVAGVKFTKTTAKLRDGTPILSVAVKGSIFGASVLDETMVATPTASPFSCDRESIKKGWIPDLAGTGESYLPEGRLVTLDLSRSTESIERRVGKMIHVVCLKRNSGGAISAMVRSFMTEGRLIDDPSKSNFIESQKTTVFVSGIKAQIPAIARAFGTRVGEIHAEALAPGATTAASTATSDASMGGTAK